jgi:hypothetical protein
LYIDSISTAKLPAKKNRLSPVFFLVQDLPIVTDA